MLQRTVRIPCQFLLLVESVYRIQSKKRPEAIKALQDSLREPDYVQGFSNFLSPLDPSLKLSQLK